MYVKFTSNSKKSVENNQNLFLLHQILFLKKIEKRPQTI